MSKSILQCPTQEQVIDFVEGRLSEHESIDLERHVIECPKCLEILRNYEPEPHKVVSESEIGEREFEATKLRIPLDTPHRSEETISASKFTTPRIISFQDDSHLAFLSPPQADHQLGMLGKYEVIDVLGSGGMGIVLKAFDPELKRHVAIKVIRPEVASKAEPRKRFLREAQALAAIANDHVVPVYEVISNDSVPYIVMPFIEGDTLQEKLRQGESYSEAQILLIAEQIALGLQAAHSRGLIHRDIKPANLFLDEQSKRWVLIDFGLVRPAEEDSIVTHSDAVPGTPAYMSPEQASRGEVDARADLFSLGCVLYELATGKSPFRRDSITASLVAVNQERPVSPRRLNPHISNGLSKLINDLLKKDPSKRLACADEVLDRLSILSMDSVEVRSKIRPILIGAGFAALVVMMGVIIKITNSNKETAIVEAPQGSHIRIDGNGNVEVNLPRKETTVSLKVEDQQPEVPDWKEVLERKDYFEYERGVAEWVISIGGAVSVFANAPYPAKISMINELPLGKFCITHLHLGGNKNVYDENVGIFRRLRGVRNISLHTTKVTSKGLPQLAPQSIVYTFLIANSEVTARDLEKFPHVETIRSLSLNSNQINGDWSFLRQCQSLTEVSLLSPSYFGLNSLLESELLPTTQLNTITLKGPQIARPQPSTIRQLQQLCPTMRILCEDSANYSIVGTDPLPSHLRKLLAEDCLLQGMLIDGSWWDSSEDDPLGLGQVRILYDLSFPVNSRFTIETADMLKPLVIKGMITGFGLKGADLLVNQDAAETCTSLQLDGAELSDEGLLLVARFPRLTRLSIKRTMVSRQAVEEFKKLRPLTIVETDYGEFGITSPE